jgi:hypothetical protein
VFKAASMARRRATTPREPMTALATRIPAALRQRLRVHCLQNGIEIQTFVMTAIREALAMQGRAKVSSVR